MAQEREAHPNNMLISAGDLTGASPMLSALLRDYLESSAGGLKSAPAGWVCRKV
ncbi:hypothetical protein [Dongia sp.]|uniref:hypothetical protein n=1 Tax=Dongia sp. TaxID=1977262 RepID=UPI0035B3BF79